jgi:phospholipid-translocating ATPase
VCVCRCSPTQKAVVASKIKEITKKRIACVGDGGNDVSMIQQADVGIGIVGKEGLQASMAADYSILEFRYLTRLILWHGRLSYVSTATVSQFVIHRGMIIAFI